MNTESQPEPDLPEKSGPSARVRLDIATSIYEALHANGGDLDGLDADAIKAAFPRHEDEVEQQIDRLREVPRRGSIGRYRRVRRLGVGASGAVYEAVHDVTGRRVAIKVILGAGVARADIEREARALADLDHPNIARLHSFETDGNTGFLVIDFVDGTSLDRALARLRQRALPDDASLVGTVRELAGAGGQRLADPETAPTATGGLGGGYFREVAAILAGAAEGLAFAHRRGIVHRDVKPANLLVDVAGHPKVTDFGFAKGASLLRLSRTGLFVGTAYYASPEQVKPRAPVGPASDIWSLGVTLYELVTLCVPFVGATAEDVFESVAGGRYTKPRERNPRIPVDLDLIIARCLEVHPELRYPTADALAADLRRFAAGEAIHTRPVGVASRVMSRLRHPSRGLVAALVAALLLILIPLGARVQTTVETDRDRTARKQALKADAETALKAGLAVGDRYLLAEALDRAAEAVRVDPDDATSKQTMLVTAGRIAYEYTDDERAAAYLEKAHKLGSLAREDRVMFGLAALGAGRYDLCRGALEELAGDDPRVRDALSLSAAFEQAKPMDVLVDQCVALGGIAGMPPDAMLATTVATLAGREAGQLVFFPEGLDGPWRPWRIRVDGQDRMLDAILLESAMPPRLLAAGDTSLLRSVGPIGPDGPASWERMEHPATLVGGADARARGNLHLAILPPPEGLRTPVVVASRNRALAAATLTDAGIHDPVDVPWVEGEPVLPNDHAEAGDIHALVRVDLSDGPAVLVGLGLWRCQRVVVARLSAEGILEDAASAIIGGAPRLACLPARDLILASNPSYGHGENPTVHGRAAPRGWEYGVHALRFDQRLQALVPTASWRLPRPVWADPDLPLVTHDVLASDAGPEVLLAEGLSGANGRVTGQRTHVAALPPAQPDRFEPRLRLPGAIRCATHTSDGSTVLIVDGERGQIVVRIPGP